MQVKPHVTAVLFLSKEPPVPANKQVGWVQQPVWTFCRREKPFDPAGIQNRDCPGLCYPDSKQVLASTLVSLKGGEFTV